MSTASGFPEVQLSSTFTFTVRDLQRNRPGVSTCWWEGKVGQCLMATGQGGRRPEAAPSRQVIAVAALLPGVMWM